MEVFGAQQGSVTPVIRCCIGQCLGDPNDAYLNYNVQ